MTDDAKRGAMTKRQPSPTYWPGRADQEKVGPTGAGTPHARMHWFWERMRPHACLIEELTGWNPVLSTYRFEAAIADAFDRLAEATLQPVVPLERAERAEAAARDLAKVALAAARIDLHGYFDEIFPLVARAEEALARYPEYAPEAPGPSQDVPNVNQ